MSFLCNNVAAITVAAVASAIAWLFGGTRADWLVPAVPWLLVFMVEVIFCFPQRHRGETTYDARQRVWHELKCSPVVWISVGFLLLQLVPFVNNGLCPSCDADLIAQGARAKPPFRMLPFCVNRWDHLEVLYWFALALTSMIAVSHCLTRRGKRLVIELIVWNGTALAALGFLQVATDAHGPYWTMQTTGSGLGVFFSTFGYPNMAGDYFTVLFGLAVALWADRFEQVRREESQTDVSELSGNEAKKYGRFWRKHYFLLPAVVLFCAALNTLSRAAILLTAATAVVYFLHTWVVVLSRMRKSRRVFFGVWSMMAFGLVIFFSTVTMPSKIQREVNTLESFGLLDRVTGKSQYHTRVATAIWKDHLLFGCGGWGYMHLSPTKLSPDEKLKMQTVGGANVHNDHLQFLAEHGLVGFGALLAIVVLLVWPVCRRWHAMVKGLRFKKGKDLPPRPIQIFALPAPVLFLMVSALVTVVHACADCPMRSCAVLTLFFITLAALPGFMPKHEIPRCR